MEKTKEELKKENDLLKDESKELSEEEIENIAGGNEYDDIFKKEKGPGKYEYEIYKNEVEKDKDEFSKKF